MLSVEQQKWYKMKALLLIPVNIIIRAFCLMGTEVDSRSEGLGYDPCAGYV